MKGLDGLLCFLVLLFMGSVVFARNFFNPLASVAATRETSARFTLVDVFCLIWILQIPLVIIAVFPRRGPVSWLVAALTCAIVVGLWRSAIRQLSCLEVSPRQRVIHLAVVLPVTILVSLALPGVTVTLAVVLFAEPEFRPYSFGLVAVLLVISLVLKYCSIWIRRIATQLKTDNAKDTSVE